MRFTLSVSLLTTALAGCVGGTPDDPPPETDGVTTNSNATTGGLAQLALDNVGGTACGRNSLGETSFYSSCTGNGGQPEYWCSDFVKWVWARNGVDVHELTAAAGSFYVYGQHHNTLKNSPQLGDAVVFDYGGNGYADHVAIVTQVLGNGRIETASGDWNGQSGSEAQFSRTSHVILNDPAYPGVVGSQPGVIGMTISGFISPISVSAAECPNATGHTVGVIHEKYAALGGCGSVLGIPITDETGTPDGIGRYNVFQNGSIYWTAQGGAFEVHGSIRDTWKTLGWEAGAIGYPITDETGTPDGIGRYNVFQHGSIYFSPATGAHEVMGLIRDKWATLGWEAGSLGYPIAAEKAVSGGRQTDFQHGSIKLDTATGQTTVTMTP